MNYTNIFQFARCSCLAAIILFMCGYRTTVQAQPNLNMHYNLDPNHIMSIDYITNMSFGDGYLLSGNTYPPNVAGYINSGPAGTLPRIQFRAVDADLNTQIYKTYIEALEENGTCVFLDLSFYTHDAKQTSDGGFIFCGTVGRTIETSYCSNFDVSEPFLLKTDQNGTVLWYKKYSTSGGVTVFRSVVEDPITGNFLVAGATGVKASILTTDASGSYINGYQYPTQYYTEFREITPHQRAGVRYYALTGIVYNEENVGADMLLTVVDDNGNLATSYGIAEIKGMTGIGINDAYDNNHVVITGNSYGTVIVKIDPMTLNIDFAKTYKSSQQHAQAYSMGMSVVVNPYQDYNICIAGVHNNWWPPASGNLQTLYLETDMNGNLWRYSPIGGGIYEYGMSIALNSNAGYPAFSGYTGVESFAIRNNYGQDCAPNDPVIVSEFNPDINVYPMQNIPYQEFSHQIRDIDLTPSDKLYCGMLKPTIINKNTLTTQRSSIVPNPSSGRTSLEFSGLPSYKQGIVKVSDMLGRTVFQKEMDNSKQEGRVQLDLPNQLPSGQYIVSLYCDGVQVTVQRLSLVR